MKIVDYNDKYADEIDELENDVWEADGAKAQYEDGHIFKIAVDDNENFMGVAYGKSRGDLFDLEIVVVKKEYRHQRIATALVRELLNDKKLDNISNVIAPVLLINNHMNAEGLMREFGFSELYRVKDYWGDRKPNEYCKVCESTPCKCTCVFFLKKIK